MKPIDLSKLLDEIETYYQRKLELCVELEDKHDLDDEVARWRFAIETVERIAKRLDVLK